MMYSEVSIIAGGRAVNGYTNILHEIQATVIQDSKGLSTELESLRHN